MFFTETILSKGTKVYKGQAKRCRALGKQFYVTTSKQTAKVYGYPCVFYTKKSVRLFQITPDNLSKLLKYKGISELTKTLIRLLFGIQTKLAYQSKAFKFLFSETLPGSGNIRSGQRLSIAELDHILAVRLSKEFFGPEMYDGYYAPGLKTMFHGGRFHSEIMLCDAYKTLQTEQPKPRLTITPSQIPNLFIKYCQTHRALLTRHAAFESIYLGGGMAVKLYLKARNKQISPQVANTSDFDFTFGVAKKLSDPTLYVRGMKQIMSNHINKFLEWLGPNNQIKLLVDDSYIPDIKLLPATKKYVYQVISYRLLFPGKKPVDFVDTTLAYVPGISRSHIMRPISQLYGIPMESLKYLYKNVAVVLAGSFIFPGIKPRNPLRGQRPEKGLKNTARLMALTHFVPKRQNLKPLLNSSQHMLRKIIEKDYKGGKKAAESVIRHVI
jgi:hypothetical protein